MVLLQKLEEELCIIPYADWKSSAMAGSTMGYARPAGQSILKLFHFSNSSTRK